MEDSLERVSKEAIGISFKEISARLERLRKIRKDVKLFDIQEEV
jgi:hypothetical protein